MIPGVSYALIINNFSNTGNGFSIEFGGTGTFLGPEASFTVAPADTVCLNEGLTFTDASSSPEGIVDWEWNFGLGASPATATGPGPHTVNYNTPGLKSVVLSVTSDAGCIVTDIQTVEVLSIPEAIPTVVTDYCGPDDQTGGIYLDVSGGTPPYLFDWQNSGVFLPGTSLLNVETGTYDVVVQDSNGCQQSYSIIVPEGLSLQAGVNPVTPPTCNSGSDGSISISIDIANYPIQYDFGNGLQSDSFLTNIPAGIYNVYVVDAAGCDGNFTIEVVDYPPLLVGMDPTDISCFGEQDGSITALPTGGAGDYIYLWSNGATGPVINNLAQGTYTVTVTDAAGCTATTDAAIIEPPELFLTVDVTNVICNGYNSGIITANASGGTPPYEYSADGVNFQTDPNLGGLFAGTYDAVVRDSRGCLITVQATVTEPPPLFVDAGEDQTIDLGYTANIHTLITPLFHPVTISWDPSETLDCNDCPDPTALPTATTTYYITVVDDDNCSATDSITIHVILNRPIYIPNAFSPNNDGLNDFITVYGGPAARIVRRLKIFDRWGELVFDGADIPLNYEPAGWNGIFKGKEMDPAVFAYFAEVEFIDGVVVLYEGDVTIIR
jgi:gliding motility-associated-like protein